jgi:tetratricopeptide (TPR) repeat protein
MSAMRSAVLLLALLALPAAAAARLPEKPGAGLADVQLPACDYRTDYWTPVGSLSNKLLLGDHAAVEAELEELHASFEENRACENRIKWAFHSGFRWEDALRPSLDRWVAARPDAWTAHAVRGLFWGRKLWEARSGPEQHRAAEMRAASEHAIADLERAIALKPNAMVAWAGILDAHAMWDDRPRLEKAFAAAIAIDPVSIHVLETMLGALDPRWGDDFERTEAVVAQARRQQRRNPRVARLYGYPDAWRARKIEAGPLEKSDEDRLRIIDAFSRALRYADASTDWHYRRAWNYSELGNHEAVLAEVTFALEKPQPEERWFDLKADALSRLGRADEALAAAREGLTRFPGSVDLSYHEGNALLEMGRLAEAERLFRAALTRTRVPDQRVKHLRGLGATLSKLERWAEAERVLGEAIAIDDGHGLTWHRLAEARWNLGHREDAVRAYERFIELTAGEDWADEMAMRAQEKIDLVRSGDAPPAAGAKR